MLINLNHSKRQLLAPSIRNYCEQLERQTDLIHNAVIIKCCLKERRLSLEDAIDYHPVESRKLSVRYSPVSLYCMRFKIRGIKMRVSFQYNRKHS